MHSDFVAEVRRGREKAEANYKAIVDEVSSCLTLSGSCSRIPSGGARKRSSVLQSPRGRQSLLKDCKEGGRDR